VCPQLVTLRPPVIPVGATSKSPFSTKTDLKAAKINSRGFIFDCHDYKQADQYI